MQEFVRVAQEEGATLICGGKRPDVSILIFFLHAFLVVCQHLQSILKKKKKKEPPYTLEIKFRGQIHKFKSLILGVHKLSFRAQTIDSLTNFQALTSLRKCQVAMLHMRCQGRYDIEQKSIHDKPKNN